MFHAVFPIVIPSIPINSDSAVQSQDYRLRVRPMCPGQFPAPEPGFRVLKARWALLVTLGTVGVMPGPILGTEQAPVRDMGGGHCREHNLNRHTVHGRDRRLIRNSGLLRRQDNA